MQAQLNLPPLHTFIEYEAIKTNFRFRCSELNEVKSLTENSLTRLGQRYDEKMKYDVIDDMIKKYNFEKNFSVEFPDREDWYNNLIDLDEDADYWFTDGSRTESGTGCGIYCSNTNEQISYGLNKDSTVFLAEVQAINCCATLNLEQNIRNRTIYINSDSKSALEALQSSEITSGKVLETVNSLNSLGKWNKLKIRWIPAHKGLDGNEKADSLAKAATKMYGPEPFIGLPWCILKSCMKKWMYDESPKFWESQKNLKAKLGQEMIGFPEKIKAKDILKLNRQ